MEIFVVDEVVGVSGSRSEKELVNEIGTEVMVMGMGMQVGGAGVGVGSREDEEMGREVEVEVVVFCLVREKYKFVLWPRRRAS